MVSSIAPFGMSVFVVHQHNYLIIRRSSKYLQGTWQMISGRIEPGETAWYAALREIQEETGLITDRLYSADFSETFYEVKNDKVFLCPVFVAFVDDPAAIRLSNEHDAYEWLPFEEASKRLIFAEQKRGLAHIHENFVLKEPHPFFLIDTKGLRKVVRHGVYGIVINENKILLTVKKKGPFTGLLDLPGGGIEAGETHEQTLRREFHEEVGMSFDSMQLFTDMIHNRDVKDVPNPYHFHHTGIIYRVSGLQQIQNAIPEETFDWYPLKELDLKHLTPFAGTSVKLLLENNN